MKNVVWVCGDWKDDGAWELRGVFDSEDKAKSHCKKPTHFIGPAELNEKLPDETTEWVGCYYPHPLSDSQAECEHGS